jgi:uncharacterized protein
MPEPALVIIARAPASGRVKTRLAAGIGAAGALFVYRQLLEVVGTAQTAWPGPVLLHADGDDATWADTPLAHLPRRRQPAGGLGTRIAAALAWGCAQAGSAIAIGTDCPGLTSKHLHHLATLLTTVPVVFGPAEDGGYWGIAVANPQIIPLLTDDDLPWSTSTILRDSRTRLDHAGTAYAIGDLLADCDDADDLAVAVASGFLTWPSPVENRS